MTSNKPFIINKNLSAYNEVFHSLMKHFTVSESLLSPNETFQQIMKHSAILQRALSSNETVHLQNEFSLFSAVFLGDYDDDNDV